MATWNFKNGIALASISALNGVAIANVSAVNGISKLTNALKTSLISYWKFDEASGNAADSHGSETLTNNNSATFGTGLINNGANLASASTQYFSRSDDSALSTGDIDFTLSCWVKLTTKATNMHLMGKWRFSDNNREYRLVYASSADRFLFQVSAAGTSGVNATANTFGSPSTGAWIHVLGYHDSVNNVIGIKVNNGTADTTSHSTGVFDGAAEMSFGRDMGTGTDYLNGSIDEAAFWKRMLTSGERTQIYNSGAGYAYSNFQ